MGTLTIRNLPEDLVERIKAAAEAHGCSMEQEVRALLQGRYAPRREVLARIRGRWDELAGATGEELMAWRDEGRR